MALELVLLLSSFRNIVVFAGQVYPSGHLTSESSSPCVVPIVRGFRMVHHFS